MPARGIHHVDLAVRDLERSLAFYLAILGPVGLREEARYPSYRGTEEVVYLRFGAQLLGLRPADGGEHHYYGVGVEHVAFYVDTREEVDAAYQRCLDLGAQIHFPPEDDRDIEGYYEMFVFDPDGLRVEIACEAEEVANALRGRLEGDPSHQARGYHLHVVDEHGTELTIGVLDPESRFTRLRLDDAREQWLDAGDRPALAWSMGQRWVVSPR